MRSFGRVLWIARRHAWWIVVATLSMLVVSVATAFTFNLVRPIFNDLLESPAADTAGGFADAAPDAPLVEALDRSAAWMQERITALGGGDRRAVLVLVLIGVVAKNLFGYLSKYAVAQLGLATIRDLRDRLFDALLAQSARFFSDTTSGILIARVVNDVQLINEALSERFHDLLLDTLMVIVLVAYVVSLEPRLALATFVLAPVLLAPVVHFSRRLRRRSRQSQERMGDLTGVLDEAVKGVRVVQAFGMERFESHRFRDATQRHFWANLKARAIQAANAPVMEVVGAFGAVALIAWATREIGAGRMTEGDFMAFLLAVYALYNPIKRLNKFNLALQQAAVASDRVFDILDAPVEVRDRPDAVELEGVDGGIRFEGVSFAYPGGAPVLRELDLDIPAGSTVALVGPSGSGKSTIAALIPRFWDVGEGRVTVGGRDVREVTLRSLRSRIGVVTQETVLFNDSIRANIAFGRSDPDPEEVRAAARAAFADGFVRELPDGYDTPVGELGNRLSGGQRQRLAIARALFKDAPILILDEATSALDPEAERLVQQALDNLMRGRTTLVIAHRLATVRRADRIVVLDRGRIVESGRHDELIATGGAYARMVRMQDLDPGSDAVVETGGRR